MSKTPPNLADLPPDVQAFVTAQAAELARKDAELLGKHQGNPLYFGLT